MEMYLVGLDDLHTVWPFVRNDIREALKYSNGRYDEKTVADSIISCLRQLWLLTDEDKILMSMVSQIINYPTGLKVCEVMLLGGKQSKEWAEFVTDELSKWVASIGCDRLQIIGRKGWEKVLKNWKSVLVMMEKPVGENHE
jgi:hypothetical protein